MLKRKKNYMWLQSRRAIGKDRRERQATWGKEEKRMSPCFYFFFISSNNPKLHTLPQHQQFVFVRQDGEVEGSNTGLTDSNLNPWLLRTIFVALSYLITLSLGFPIWNDEDNNACFIGLLWGLTNITNNKYACPVLHFLPFLLLIMAQDNRFWK